MKASCWHSERSSAAPASAEGAEGRERASDGGGMMGGMILRFGARSDRGAVRPVNQDSAYAGPRLLVIADGMGGMAAGDLASQLTIAAVAPLDRTAAARAAKDPADTLVDELRTAAEDANRRIRDEVAANPALEGMGTTL